MLRMDSRLLVILILLAPACSDDRGSNGSGSSSGNTDGIGNHCDGDADCETNECYIGPSGGYCTTACSDEGSESQCPLDTVCKPIQGGARRCLLICGSDSACDVGDCGTDHCPSGSSCVSVSNTTRQACEPEPK